MNTQEVKKEDCIRHVQKRLSTALHSYKRKRWGAVLSDGKGTASKDVTDIIYCMQTAMSMQATQLDNSLDFNYFQNLDLLALF